MLKRLFSTVIWVLIVIQINTKVETLPQEEVLQEEVSDNEHVKMRKLAGVVNLMDFCSAIYWKNEEISAPELTDGDLIN